MTGRTTIVDTLVMRRIVVHGQALELWENPDDSFDWTQPAQARYAAAGAWTALFNALTLRTAPLRAE